MREREKERKRPTGAVDGRFMYYPQLRLALTVHSFGDSLSLSLILCASLPWSSILLQHKV